MSLTDKLTQKEKDRDKEGTYWKPAEGDILEGVASDIEDTITANGDAKVMDIETAEGKTFTIFVNSVLEKQFAEEKVKPGDKIAIKFLGLFPSHKNPKRKFKDYLVVKDNEA